MSIVTPRNLKAECIFLIDVVQKVGTTDGVEPDNFTVLPKTE